MTVIKRIIRILSLLFLFSLVSVSVWVIVTNLLNMTFTEIVYQVGAGVLIGLAFILISVIVGWAWD